MSAACRPPWSRSQRADPRRPIPRGSPNYPRQSLRSCNLTDRGEIVRHRREVTGVGNQPDTSFARAAGGRAGWQRPGPTQRLPPDAAAAAGLRRADAGGTAATHGDHQAAWLARSLDCGGGAGSRGGGDGGGSGAARVPLLRSAASRALPNAGRANHLCQTKCVEAPWVDRAGEDHVAAQMLGGARFWGGLHHEGG